MSKGKRPGRVRLDLSLVEKNLCENRSKARALVLAGEVLVDGQPARSPGQQVRPDQEAPPSLESRMLPASALPTSAR